MGKKGYGSCFGEDYQQYIKHIIKYVDNSFAKKLIMIILTIQKNNILED